MQKRQGLWGERLKEAREDLHMTQGALAVALGITTDPDSKAAKTTISRYENGHSQPGSDVLDAMVGALNVSADWLLGRTTDRKGVITESSLPADEIEVLHAYRQLQKKQSSNKYFDLGLKKRDEAPGNDPPQT